MKINISGIFKNKIIKGTFILTFASFVSRITGFLFRIFLTGKIGTEALGIIQLIFPIQVICGSICGFGFETAISKLTAQSKVHSAKEKNTYLINGIVISFIISLMLSILTFNFSEILSSRYLLEPRCNVLIKILSLSIPLCGIHHCIYGYYLGHQNTKIPAISQIIEQFARIIFIYVLCCFAEAKGIKITPSFAIAGTVIGELASTLYCLLKIKFTSINLRISDISFKSTKTLLSISTPLSLNRLLASLLQSFQNILIPNMLILYGLSSSQSLSIYGILTGLVIPLVFFPGSIINSFSLMILPTISEANSLKNNRKINIATNKILELCFIFGIFCSAIFFNYGKQIGILLFDNPEAGNYISLLGFVCPFIYISSTLSSVINGLGHTTITFIINIITSLIQIFLIVTVIPKYGVYGFIDAFIIGNMINSLILFFYMRSKITVSYSSIYTLVYGVVLSFILTNMISLVLLFIDGELTRVVLHFVIFTILYCMMFRKRIERLIR